jgi:hypothetical protein
MLTVTGTWMHGFFFFDSDDPASWSLFGFLNGHPLPMVMVALLILWKVEMDQGGGELSEMLAITGGAMFGRNWAIACPGFLFDLYAAKA